MSTDSVCDKKSTKKIFTKFLFLFAVVSIGLISCKKDLEQAMLADNVLTINASASDLVLLQKNQNNTALELSWTKGSNSGTNASIDYTLQIDKKGSNFATPLSLYLGKAAYSQKYTVRELNDIALKQFKLTAGVPTEMEARVKAVPATDSTKAQTSPIVTFQVTPYTPVSSTLYLIGDATPNGWDAGNATQLTASATDATTFTWQGTLKPGEFKFITNKGQFLPSYNKGADNTKLFYRTLDNQPDNKFIITDAGSYSVTVNLVDLTISFEKLAGAPYTKLWIVGDATPNGWNIDNPNQMKVDPTDPFIFTYYEVLKAGEFKIPTATGNWGGDFYMPLTNNPDISNAGVRLVRGGNPDFKWKITTPGAYKITLNLRDLTISIKPFTPYTKLWMVGDATPNGWNINAPNEMVKDATNPNVFTYTGALKAGEFKIPVATGDWGTDYFMPLVNGQGIASTDAKFVKGGNPDNKWKITEAATYKVTLNQLYETISIVKQ